MTQLTAHADATRLADGRSGSAAKAHAFEAAWAARSGGEGATRTRARSAAAQTASLPSAQQPAYSITAIPRSREVRAQ